MGSNVVSGSATVIVLVVGNDTPCWASRPGTCIQSPPEGQPEEIRRQCEGQCGEEQLSGRLYVLVQAHEKTPPRSRRGRREDDSVGVSLQTISRDEARQKKKQCSARRQMLLCLWPDWMIGGAGLMRWRRVCPLTAEKGGRESSPAHLHYTMFSQNRIIMVATWTRVACPCGSSKVGVVPLMSPCSTAQAMASAA